MRGRCLVPCQHRVIALCFLAFAPVPLDLEGALACGRLGRAEPGGLGHAQQVGAVVGAGQQMLVLAGRELGEADGGLQEEACPRGYGVGGAAIGVAGAVTQGQGGRHVVIVAGAGGGELLEGDAGEERGGEGCGQAGVGSRGSQASDGIVIDTRARMGYTAPIGTTDQDRIRHLTVALPPAYAARLFDARESGASDARLQEIAAEALKEGYFQDGGRRAGSLEEVRFTDIEHLEFDL